MGNAGWKGEPVDGAAELGYAVAPSRRGCGTATAVVRELLDRARAARLQTVVAHTLAEPSPSTSVMARCGFANVARVLDPRWRVGVRRRMRKVRRHRPGSGVGCTRRCHPRAGSSS